MAPLKAPFPWFGGKAFAAARIWAALGAVPNYVEPFAGSLAVLLNRPHVPGIETVNDLDGFVCNAWRAIAANPEAVARWADWPASECDLHARHLWLTVRREALGARLMADPDYYDIKIAGWWLWGVACWIGSGWCGDSGAGPWGIVTAADGTPEFRHLEEAGQGVSRQLPHLGNAGRGVQQPSKKLLPWFTALQTRLQRVRVCCGDWTRVLGDSATVHNGLTGVVLDPPYGQEAGRDNKLYAHEGGTIAAAVRAWCLARNSHPELRIVLCGYEGEHEELKAHGWRVEEWKARGGYGSSGDGRGRANAHRERLWFNPACLRSDGQPTLW